jgi:hypothetical protein
MQLDHDRLDTPSASKQTRLTTPCGPAGTGTGTGTGTG